MRYPIMLIAGLAVWLATAAPVVAQFGGGGPPIRFGFGGGVSVPTSDAAEALKTGINGQAFVLVNTGMLPPLRFNVGYQQFELERSALPGRSGESTILSGVAGLNLGLVQLGPLRPYLTAGLGAFNVKTDTELAAGDVAAGTPMNTSQTRFGIDGGGGITLRLGRLEAFVEGRVQNVYTEAGLIDSKTIRAVPVTFGLLF